MRMKERFVHSWLFLLLLQSICYLLSEGIQTTDPTWDLLQASPIQSSRFSARNGHAVCVFKGMVWLTGGRTEQYTRYNLKPGFKAGDVWRSSDGGTWTQETLLLGDFYAQNADVVQPGPVAPWFPRFGHTLTALDLNGDGEDDIMIQMGGFAPIPSNDIWITEDGITWTFCGSAPWDPRAWHSAVVMDRLLYVLGGTPLNNEVWTLDISSIQKISRPRAPLTRAFYLPYTYTMTWMQQPNAPWSPRCGMGAITQFYFNESIQTVDEGAPRIVLMGGYGGWLEQTSSSASSSSQGVYDGIRCREDVWAMAQTGVWYLLNSSAAFGPRAWFGFASLVSPYDPRLDIASISPGRNNSYPARMFAVGGGNIGFSTSSSAVISSMDGMVDVYFSIDGITWTRVNYQEGGGSSLLALYSSEVWAKLTIAREITYVGLWGMTLTSFDFSNASQTGRGFLLIAGDQTGVEGTSTNYVYRSLTAFLCEEDGVTCYNRGTCSQNASGCVCNTGPKVSYSGLYCEDAIIQVSSAMRSVGLTQSVILSVLVILAGSMSIVGIN